MTLQRQTLGPIKPLAPKKIAFVLPGRRTLSEHLPAEVIDVPITVAQRSRYLRKAIVRQALNDPSERQIGVPDVDAMGFRVYIEWLKSGKVESHTTTFLSSSGRLLLRDSFDLIFAHIAGSQLQELDFQDYIIDTLAKLLDASQTPDLKVLEVVFLEKSASNILKQFVVDRMFAIERKMLGMMRGVIDSADTALGCEYHVHEVGECYRNKVHVEHAKDTNFVNGPQNTSNTNMTNAHNNNVHLESSSPSFPSRTRTATGTYWNMPKTTYFGSTEWSREVHGLARESQTPDLRTEKPLPTIPSLTLQTSLTPPSSPCSPQTSFPNHTDNKDISTQDPVRVFLVRLSQKDGSLTTPSTPLDSPRSEIPALVSECLERFKKRGAVTESKSSSESSPPDEASPPQEQGSKSTEPHAPKSPSSLRQVRWQPSFEDIPKPRLIQTRTELPRKYVHCSDLSPILASSPSSQSQPTHTPIVERKPAPHRGEDWLKQYDSLNALVGHTPVVMAKRSKKSRLKELLRSESVMSKVELEGSMLKVKSGTGRTMY